MDIEELTVKQVRGIQELFPAAPNSEKPDKGLNEFAVGKWVILRTYSAGVHFGVLKRREGKEAILTEARRIWSWEGAFTLSAVAQIGVKSAKMSISEPEKLVTEVIEVIPVTDEAMRRLSGMNSHE